MLKMDICKKCGDNDFIVNRTHYLCSNCNHIRLHGESISDTFKRKQTEYAGKANAKKQRINQVSEKQHRTNKILHQVKNGVTQKSFDDIGFHQCSGCLQTASGLDRSHILSVAQRPSLQTDERNINLFCRNCHEKWESGNIAKMTSLLTFQKDMLFIFNVDKERFNKIYFKLEDEIAKSNSPRLIYLKGILDSFVDYFCSKFEDGRMKCQSQCGRCKKIENEATL